jgi:hypothetical protein
VSDQEKPKLRSERLIELIEKAAAILDEQDVKLLAEAAQTARRLESGEGFNCESVVSMRDGRALLDCSWMGMLAQISPEQARSIAQGLIGPAGGEGSGRRLSGAPASARTLSRCRREAGAAADSQRRAFRLQAFIARAAINTRPYITRAELRLIRCHSLQLR